MTFVVERSEMEPVPCFCSAGSRLGLRVGNVFVFVSSFYSSVSRLGDVDSVVAVAVAVTVAVTVAIDDGDIDIV
jgi:hypothetical protein